MVAVKALCDAGVPFDCFEKSDRVGGNWVFKNRNGMSSAYRSLHINTSRGRMQYADFPMPSDYPDYPHHELIARYFEAYVETFGLRDKIRFETSVESVVPEGSGYSVTLDNGQRRRYDALIVANGHHWDPRLPEPRVPGNFSGIELHSHHYIDPGEPVDLIDRRVVVVGAGNSAMDIACELGRKGNSAKVFLSMRRGAWVLPKYLLGKPLDRVSLGVGVLPPAARRKLAQALYRVIIGRFEDYGLSPPDHELGQAHPTISSELFSMLGSGDITPKPAIRCFEGQKVTFADGSSDGVDAVVYCTGYKVSFPFFEPSFLAAPDNDLPLFRRVFAPRHPNLFFIGLCQPLGAIMPIAEAQAKWVALYLTGRYALPPLRAMLADIERERRLMFARYVPSQRHTMQVDFDDYMKSLRAEVASGKTRACKLGFRLPVVPASREATRAHARTAE
jgi:hypothetical protein